MCFGKNTFDFNLDGDGATPNLFTSKAGNELIVMQTSSFAFCFFKTQPIGKEQPKNLIEILFCRV